MEYDKMSLGELITRYVVHLDSAGDGEIAAAIDRGWPRQGEPCKVCKDTRIDNSDFPARRCTACDDSPPMLTIPDDERTVEAIAEAVQRWHDTNPTLNPGRFVVQALRALSGGK